MSSSARSGKKPKLPTRHSRRNKQSEQDSDDSSSSFHSMSTRSRALPPDDEFFVGDNTCNRVYKKARHRRLPQTIVENAQVANVKPAGSTKAGGDKRKNKRKGKNKKSGTTKAAVEAKESANAEAEAKAAEAAHAANVAANAAKAEAEADAADASDASDAANVAAEEKAADAANDEAEAKVAEAVDAAKAVAEAKALWSEAKAYVGAEAEEKAADAANDEAEAKVAEVVDAAKAVAEAKALWSEAKAYVGAEAKAAAEARAVAEAQAKAAEEAEAAADSKAVAKAQAREVVVGEIISPEAATTANDKMENFGESIAPNAEALQSVVTEYILSEEPIPEQLSWIKPGEDIFVLQGNKDKIYPARAMSYPEQKKPMLHGRTCPAACDCKIWWVYVKFASVGQKWVPAYICTEMSTRSKRGTTETVPSPQTSSILTRFIASCTFEKLPIDYYREDFGAAVNIVLAIVSHFGYLSGQADAIGDIGLERIIRDMFRCSSQYTDDDTSWDSNMYSFGFWCNDCVPRVPPYESLDGSDWSGKFDVRALEQCLRDWFPEKRLTISASKGKTIEDELREYDAGSISLAQCVLNRKKRGYGKYKGHIKYIGVCHDDLMKDEYDEIYQSPIMIENSQMRRVVDEGTNAGPQKDDVFHEVSSDDDVENGDRPTEEIIVGARKFVCHVQRFANGRLKVQNVDSWIDLNMELHPEPQEEVDAEEDLDCGDGLYVKRVLRLWSIWDDKQNYTCHEFEAVTDDPVHEGYKCCKTVTVTHSGTVPGKNYKATVS